MIKRIVDRPRPNEVSLSDFAYRQPVDPRRRPEYADSQMIQEDNNAMANLPRNFINKQFSPGKFQPYYWMESEVKPFNAIRHNESSTDKD